MQNRDNIIIIIIFLTYLVPVVPVHLSPPFFRCEKQTGIRGRQHRQEPQHRRHHKPDDGVIIDDKTAGVIYWEE